MTTNTIGAPQGDKAKVLPYMLYNIFLPFLNGYILCKGQRGMEKAKAEVFHNLLVADKLTVCEIASFAGVSEAFVKKIRTSLEKKRISNPVPKNGGRIARMTYFHTNH
ncbi:MAG: hypothetical protein QM610_12375 [Chitinophagaceae bacterium]